VGHRHSKEQLLAAALEAATDDGLSGLTYGSLARRLGVSDRIVVYYFPTKHDLISEVLLEMGARLQVALADAFTAPARTHVELARAAWPVLARRRVDPTFALFFEALGLAAAGTQPYRSLATELVDGWATWLEQYLEGDVEHRRAEAGAAIALIDGLLLLRQLSGPAAAERAASRIFGDVAP
jgi:AcrR family transcriptional regulator